MPDSLERRSREFLAEALATARCGFTGICMLGCWCIYCAESRTGLVPPLRLPGERARTGGPMIFLTPTGPPNWFTREYTDV